jgi:hypothetical protein
MNYKLPKILIDAIDNGVWRDPGPNVLLDFFGHGFAEMKLFEGVAAMYGIESQLNAAGYVDDPEFCMVRSSTRTPLAGDPRLVFGQALFIAGSTIPGDDTFVALSLIPENEDPQLLVFDWDEAVPNRWVAKGTLRQLISKLEAVKL